MYSSPARAHDVIAEYHDVIMHSCSPVGEVPFCPYVVHNQVSLFGIYPECFPCVVCRWAQLA